MGELSLSHGISMGEDTWKYVLGLLWALLHATFPFADFALFRFAIINPSHKYDYVVVCDTS